MACNQFGPRKFGNFKNSINEIWDSQLLLCPELKGGGDFDEIKSKGLFVNEIQF